MNNEQILNLDMADEMNEFLQQQNMITRENELRRERERREVIRRIKRISYIPRKQ